MRGWILLAIAWSPVVCEFTFRLRNDVLEVRGREGRFLPLCFNSAREEYAEQICTSLGRHLTSFNSVPLPSQATTYSIACVAGTNCFVYISTYCRHGTVVKCDLDLCPPDSMQSGRQCIQTGVIISPSFSDAKEACLLRVLSLPRESDRVALLRLMSESFDERRTYFTSGYRGGSQWIWDDGTPIDFPVRGQGRCLAVSGGMFHAVECDSPGTALCEVARECVYHGEYDGKRNNTQNGLPCMKWNDPSVLYYGITVAEQIRWDHNFCRMMERERFPSCFSSPSIRSPCLVPECPESSSRLELKADLSSSKCGPTFISCRDSGKCLPDDFRCDYEPDCDDGSDEEQCEDYLKYFELVGTLKIADRITEIWTYIPHVQGCARRCNESTLVCEAFSYESKTQTCLLTDSTEVSSNLAVKLTSQYYRKRFSTKDVHFQLVDFILRVAKNGTWAHVCDDGFSSVYATSICKIFGYGLALAEDPARARHPTTEAATVASSLTTSPSSSGWSVQCIRDANCTTLSACSPLRRTHCQRHYHNHALVGRIVVGKPATVGVCGRFCYFMCSTCSEAVCTDGTCLQRRQLCDGKDDCRDGSDEEDCDELSFRLVDGNEISGTVQVSFKGMWQPVCAENVGQDPANTICRTMNMGTPANVLAARVLSSYGWQLNCNGRCSLRGFTYCQYGARIRCHSTKPNVSGSCGMRRVSGVARDPLVARYARVVGGFETAAGAFPWTAAVRNAATGAHHCGASVLDRTHLITAAHCFEEDRKPTSYYVVLGDWDNTIDEGHEQKFNVSRFYFYPLYEDLFAHDLAIIEVDGRGIRFDDWTQPICLPPRDFVYQTGRKCVVSGWGSMGLAYPTRLQAAVLPIIDRAECMNSSRIYSSMSRSAFCAGYLNGGVDSCQGDSGGPLACQNGNGPYVLAGVISWGDGCAQKGQPGIYTMVAPYLTWIQGIVKLL